MQNVRFLERLQMLKSAVFWGDLDDVRSALNKLVPKVPILSTQITLKGKEYRSMPILILAVMKRDIDKVNILLRYGLDPNFVGDHLTPALPLAALLRAPRDIIRALLNAGANVNAKCVNGLSALHYLSVNKDLGSIQLLHSFRCSLDIKGDPDEVTALHMSAKAGCYSVAEYLVSHGVDVDAVCIGVGTASNIARLYGHMQLAEWLERKSQFCNVVSSPSENVMQKKIFVFDYKKIQRLSRGRESWISNSYGEHMDPINLEILFRELGYIVEIYENFNSYETKNQLEKIQRDKTPCSLILVFIQLAMSKDSVNTSDGQIFDLETFQRLFTDCPLLKDKPRILIVDTYVGKDNTTHDTDEEEASIFTSSFCSVLKRHSNEKLSDIYDRLTVKMRRKTESTQKIVVSPPSMKNFNF